VGSVRRRDHDEVREGTEGADRLGSALSLGWREGLVFGTGPADSFRATSLASRALTAWDGGGSGTSRRAACGGCVATRRSSRSRSTSAGTPSRR
jgi:hypothetical protein